MGRPRVVTGETLGLRRLTGKTPVLRLTFEALPGEQRLGLEAPPQGTSVAADALLKFGPADGPDERYYTTQSIPDTSGTWENNRKPFMPTPIRERPRPVPAGIALPGPPLPSDPTGLSAHRKRLGATGFVDNGPTRTENALVCEPSCSFSSRWVCWPR